MECSVCCEKYDKRNHKQIECNHCEYSACKACCKRHILDSINEAKCMSCSKFWTREFMIDKFTYTFFDKEYKSHIECILFEGEKLKFNETQYYIEKQNRIKAIDDEIILINQKLYDLNNEKYDLKHDIHKQQTVQNYTRLVINCPVSTCKGFITEESKCGICATKICKSCREILSDDHNENDTKNHVCDPNTLATLKEIKTSAKSCPKCAASIIRSEGCDQMFCVNCNVCFSWKTGEIQTKNIHNPHYFDWIKRMGNNAAEHTAVVDNNVCDQDFSIIIRTVSRSLSLARRSSVLEIIRIVNHIRYHTLQDIATKLADTSYELELRVRYLKNFISDDVFKHQVYKNHKSKQKNNEIHQIFETLVNVATEYIQQYAITIINGKYMDITENSAYKLIEMFNSVVELANEAFERLRTIYKNNIHRITVHLVNDIYGYSII